MITVKQLQKADWELFFQYASDSFSFKVFMTKIAPQLTLTHVFEDDKVRSVYRLGGRRCRSLTDAVREFNAAEIRRAGRALAGSPRSATHRH